MDAIWTRAASDSLRGQLAPFLTRAGLKPIQVRFQLSHSQFNYKFGVRLGGVPSEVSSRRIRLLSGRNPNPCRDEPESIRPAAAMMTKQCSFGVW